LVCLSRLGHLTGEPATPPMDVSEMELEQLSDYQLRMALWLSIMSDLRQSDESEDERHLKVKSSLFSEAAPSTYLCLVAHGYSNAM